ncbi:MAG: pyruvate synthase [Nitrososphaerota archaeon]|nr:pyruvate synthase [Nitrososphaerota archaeon]
MTKLMTGNAAAAWGARMARVDYIPAFPITPQTEIIETLSKWIRQGEMNARLVQLESEHSMFTAAGTASLAGARVFTATSSQGLLFGFEMLYNISGWRAPLVFVNVSRGLASPITLEPDHNDILSTRDSGFLQFHAENAQEVLDLVLLAYRIAEDKRVRLPVAVNMDGFYLSFTREGVELPDQKKVNDFLPEYEAEHPFRATAPVSKASSVLSGSVYSYFRYQMHSSALQANNVFAEAAGDYYELSGRHLAPVEGFMLDDAEYVLVMTNSFTTIGKQAVRRLRERGFPAGLLKLVMLRPFPKLEIEKHLSNRKVVAVFDQNIAPGSGGIIYPEVVSTLYHSRNRPEAILPVVGALGGKHLSYEELESVFRQMKDIHEGKRTLTGPTFLMTGDELEQVQNNLRIAGVGRSASK